MLRMRLQAHEVEQQAEARSSARSELLGTGSRSERIRTYNYADDRVTDHRINSSKFGINKMLEGGSLMDDFLDELLARQRELRLERFLEGLTKRGG